MSTVVAWINKPSTPTDVAVNFMDQSALELRTSAFDPKSITYTAEYVLNSGDVTRNTTVSLLTRVNKDQSVFYSVRLRTIRTVTVDSVLTEEAPADVTISWSVASVQDDAASVLAMIGAAFSLTFNGVTSKVPNTGNVGVITRSLIGQLFG